MSAAFDADVTLTIEMAFGDDPLGTHTSWTDVTSYVRAFEVQRGEPNERDVATAGRLSMVLDNRDGRFDPTYTSGAYYPNVTLGVPVRIVATYDSTDYPLFYGYADQWPMSYPDYVDSVVGFTASDGLKLLASASVASSEAAEETGTRIGNVLDQVGWTTRRSLDVGSVLCPAYAGEEQYALDLIRQAERAEAGRFFQNAAGTAVFQDRYHRSNGTAVATFGDSGAELRYSDIVLSFDDTQVWNRAEVGRLVDGVPSVQSAQDATSISTFGPRTLVYNDTWVVSDNHSKALADLIVDVYADPSPRVRSITVQPRRDPANLWPVVLDLELSDRVTVNRRPPAGNTITETLFVEAIRHSVTAQRTWSTTFELGYFNPGDENWFLLNDATFGTLSDGNVLAY